MQPALLCDLTRVGWLDCEPWSCWVSAESACCAGLPCCSAEGVLLRAEHGAEVRLVAIPPPREETTCLAAHPHAAGTQPGAAGEAVFQAASRSVMLAVHPEEDKEALLSTPKTKGVCSSVTARKLSGWHFPQLACTIILSKLTGFPDCSCTPRES